MAKAIINTGGGSGDGSDDCTVTANYVVKGQTYIGADTDDEVGAGTLELSGNTSNADVLSGKTFYTTDPHVKNTGTMVNKAGTTTQATTTLDTSNSRVQMAIPATGKYDTASKLYAPYSSVASVAGVTAAKLIQGQSALGVSGTATSDATLTSGSQMLSGVTGYSKGSKITGTIATMAGQTITPNTSSQIVSTSGKYLSGNITVAPIPSNYYNSNNSQTVFTNGSFTGPCSAGAVIAEYTSFTTSYYNDDSDNKVYVSYITNTGVSPPIENGCIVMGTRAAEILGADNFPYSNWSTYYTRVDGVTRTMRSGTCTTRKILLKQCIDSTLFSHIEFDVYHSANGNANWNEYGLVLPQHNAFGGNTYHINRSTSIQTLKLSLSNTGIGAELGRYVMAGYRSSAVTCYIKEIRLIK